MGFRRALRLRHLDRGLVAHALLDVGGVDGGGAIEVGVLEHAPAGAVHVVRDRHRVDAGGAPLVHPIPEILGVERVESRERRVRRFAAPKHDVAVQVVVDAAGAGGGVLVGDESGVRAGVVVAIGARHDFGPRGSDHVHVEVRAHGRVGVRHVADVGLHGGEDAAALLHRPCGTHGLGGRMVVGRLFGIEHGRQHAEIVGVIAYAVEVERRVELHGETRRMLDGMALGELVGRVRVRARAEHERVVRVLGVDVEVAEQGGALGYRGQVRLFVRRAGDSRRLLFCRGRLFRRLLASRDQYSAEKQ